MFILISGTCECSNLHDKNKFADKIKLKAMRWRHDLRSFGWAQCNHKSCSKRETGESELEKKDVTTEAEAGVINHEPRNAGSF